MTNDPSDRNAKIIKEFRENGGKVGGPFGGAPLLLLHSTGAKSGAERVSPMMYQAVDDGWAVFASKGGAPKNPDSFRTLTAHPQASIEVGTEPVRVRVRVGEGAATPDIGGAPWGGSVGPDGWAPV